MLEYNRNIQLINAINSLSNVISSEPFKSKDCQKLMHFILRTLKQFNIDSFLAGDIVSELALRSHKAIKSGTKIEKPLLWFRSMAYNVIREMSREREKLLFNSDFVELKASSKYIETSKYGEIELKTLKQSLSELDDLDRLIIELRFFDELPWKKVNKVLQSKGQLFNETYVRQKGVRAIKKLRKKYSSIYEVNILQKPEVS